MSNFIYGIDFGTSNSVLAIYRKDQNEIVETISIPSVIYFYQESSKSRLTCEVGKNGIDRYYQNGMKGRLMKSVKSILPNSTFSQTRVYYKNYKAEDLVSIILLALKKRADAFCGEDVKEAIMGRPALFSNDPKIDQLAENRLLKAAQKSGFEKINFQFEPIAAAFNYEQSIQSAQLALVVDLGGGTSDFSLMRLDPNKVHSTNRKNDMLGKGGVYVAGDKLDSEIMWKKVVHYFGYNMDYEYYGKEYKTPNIFYVRMCNPTGFLYLKTPKVRRQMDQLYVETKQHPNISKLMNFVDLNLNYPILKSIEQAKIEISEKDNSNIYFKNDSIHISEGMDRKEFDQIISKPLGEITKCMEDFLVKFETPKSKIDRVFLTGGTALVPTVQDYFERAFGKENLIYGDLFKSVARGLALSSVIFE